MYFEKVSLTEWRNTLNSMNDPLINLMEHDEIYDEIKLPRQGTSMSAGMDFFAPYDVIIEPNESVVIPTGIRWVVNPKEDPVDLVLQIHVRSSVGIKKNLMLNNTTAIIDADYCNSDNEGHILMKLRNFGDKPVRIEKGKGFVQGIITKFFICEGAESYDSRNGGWGSTDNK